MSEFLGFSIRIFKFCGQTIDTDETKTVSRMSALGSVTPKISLILRAVPSENKTGQELCSKKRDVFTNRDVLSGIRTFESFFFSEFSFTIDVRFPGKK